MPQDFTVDRASKKYVLGADGFLKEYANDEAAIEFNADGSYKGVLVEPQSTNLLSYSQEFEDGSWVKSSTGNAITPVVDDNNSTSPDGTVNASKIDLDLNGTTTTDWSWVYKNRSVISGVTYSSSIYIKAFSQNDIGKKIRFGFIDYISIELPENWTRIEVNEEALTSSSQSFGFRLRGVEDTADTASFLVYGAQLEESPIATSYIPTTTGAVTRVADDIYLTGASSLIGQTEGTLFVEVDWRLTNGVGQYILEISDGTANNRILIYNTNSPVELSMYARANGGSPLTNQGESSTGYSGIQKIAFVYKTDDFELYRNGSSISSDISGSLTALATLTDVDFGQAFTSGGQANMWIRSVSLYKTRLTDTECQELTTI